MRIHNRLQKVMVLFLACSLLLALCGCDRPQEDQNAQEQAPGRFWYEGVFLDEEEVEHAFIEASGDFPKYENLPFHFHVTTSFMPETRHEELYGTPVTVHITRYAYGPVQNEKGNTASDNEGLLVELSSTDERMQALINSTDAIFHITGSYSVAGQYTAQLDYADGTPIDMTIEGVFGLCIEDKSLTLEQQD